MAALIGYLQGNRGETSRCGSKESGIRAQLETWHGRIVVSLDANGDFSVAIASKRGGNTTQIAHGNVDDGERTAFGVLPPHTLDGDGVPDKIRLNVHDLAAQKIT